jgi:YHS domain-containing protein
LAAFQAEIKQPENRFSTKANHQLLLTGQYTQTACPLSGKPVAADQTVEVGGAKIGMCCDGCVAKVAAAEGLAAKAALVFADAAFDKGFEPKTPALNLEGVKCLMKPARVVSKEFSAAHQGHQVFFCCQSCVNSFTADPAAHVAKANQQLVKTGQAQQVACPFSGGPLKDDQSTEVGGVTVNYCCDNCKSKMENADEAQQLEMVFGEKGFAKGFK